MKKQYWSSKNGTKAAGVIVLLAAVLCLAKSTGSDSTVEQSAETQQIAIEQETAVELGFKYPDRLTEHYEKHGIEMGFASEEDYLKAANAVITNLESLHKFEAEDGDDVYFLESTNEIVFVSKEGFIRTYFIADGIEYFDRQ